jgi:hypothetical protein
VGKILLYIGCGYVTLVLVSSALFTGPGSLPLLVLAGIVFFLYRTGRLRALRPPAADSVARALGSAPPADDKPGADARRYARRFEEAERRLASALPEDPLENDALVAVLALYLHEPPDARAAVEDEYRSRRKEFLAWRQRARALPSPLGLDGQGLREWLQDAEELDAELSAIEGYAADIQSRAEASEGLADKALERLTRAGDVLSAARAQAATITDTSSIRALGDSLAVADARYQEAWTAMEKGKERPVTAVRLADEAAALAEDVQRRAARISALPAAIDRRLSELERSIERLEADLDHVREEFETAAASYAPSCWREIGGVGHAAQRDLERARRLQNSAARLARSGDPDHLERAEREAVEAGLAVADAVRLREVIARHLEKLETAAVEARDVVLRAEQEIDRAWTGVHEAGGNGRENELLLRATDLVQKARDGLAQPKPDWLAIVELAERGFELAREAGAQPSREAAGFDSVRLAIEDAKARAKDSRDSAWAQAIVKPTTADGAPSLLRAAEDSYQAALRMEASLSESPEEASLEATLAAFEEAQKMATQFLRAAETVEEGQAIPDDRDARAAQTLVWDLALTRGARG